MISVSDVLDMHVIFHVSQVVNMVTTAKTRSVIWTYYCLAENNNSKSICKDKIPRGGSNLKSFNITNLQKHLEHQHQEKYTELLEVEKNSCKETRDKFN